MVGQSFAHTLPECRQMSIFNETCCLPDLGHSLMCLKCQFLTLLFTIENRWLFCAVKTCKTTKRCRLIPNFSFSVNPWSGNNRGDFVNWEIFDRVLQVAVVFFNVSFCLLCFLRCWFVNSPPPPSLFSTFSVHLFLNVHRPTQASNTPLARLPTGRAGGCWWSGRSFVA
jgi:hypothetical protein